MKRQNKDSGMRSAKTRQGEFWVERRYRVQPGSREVVVVLDQLAEARRAMPLAFIVFLAALVVGPYGLAVRGIDGVLFWAWAGGSAITLLLLWRVSRWKQVFRVRRDCLEIESWTAGRLTDQRAVPLPGELRVRVREAHGHHSGGSLAHGGSYSAPVFRYHVTIADETARELFVARERTSVDTLLEALRQVVPVSEI